MYVSDFEQQKFWLIRFFLYIGVGDAYNIRSTEKHLGNMQLEFMYNNILHMFLYTLSAKQIIAFYTAALYCSETPRGTTQYW